MVEVEELFDANGEALGVGGAADNPVTPPPTLQPRQPFVLLLEWTIDQGTPRTARVRWHDGLGEHVETFALSPLYV